MSSISGFLNRDLNCLLLKVDAIELRAMNVELYSNRRTWDLILG